ncbi:MAG: VOC family protein, partial [Gammaproteobacteria bacterium]
MADEVLIDRLDQTIDLLLARRDATDALRDPELAPLAVLAAELRHLPSAAFRARLRAHLTRRTTMTTLVLEAKNIREGFTTVTPYIRVREAGLLDFLTRVFGAKETSSTQGGFGGVHREVRVGDSMLMIGEGGPERWLPFSPAAFHIYVPDVNAAFQRALAAGGTSMGDPEDRVYGERAGFIKDAFGNHWYIATAFGASYVPEGRRTVTPFIHPSGVPAYIEFLKRALGAEEEFRHEVGGVVMHARLLIGNGAIEMGDTQGASETMRTGFYLYVADADAVYEQAVAAGAKPLSPPADQSYG